MDRWNELADFYREKNILITGHTGFKGAWITKILTIMGANVTGYALNPPTEENLFEILELRNEINSEIGDIRDIKHLKKVFENVKPEIVLHMAAQPLVRTSYEEPVYTYETNVMGTVNVLECIRLTSSVKSFLNVTTDKEIDIGYVETDFLDGYDPYSNSKSCSELVTHSYKKSFLKNIPVSTARAGNVIGGGDFALDRIIPDCFRAARNKTEVILRNPKSIRPYEHVLEPLFVYLEILKRQWEDADRYEGYFNVGPDDVDCIHTDELVTYFKKYWGNGFDFKVKSDGGPHEAGFLKLNCDKLKRIYEWKPVVNIEKAVELSVDWYKAYYDGAEMKEFTKNQIISFLK